MKNPEVEDSSLIEEKINRELISEGLAVWNEKVSVLKGRLADFDRISAALCQASNDRCLEVLLQEKGVRIRGGNFEIFVKKDDSLNFLFDATSFLADEEIVETAVKVYRDEKGITVVAQERSYQDTIIEDLEINSHGSKWFSVFRSTPKE